MTVLDNYAFDSLEEKDATMARVLCGSYISICSIIILNLLIALLADTFTRVYENAIENAAMQRAKTILNLEQSLRKSHKKSYYDFIREHCSPEVKDYDAQDEVIFYLFTAPPKIRNHYDMHDLFLRNYLSFRIEYIH